MSLEVAIFDAIGLAGGLVLVILLANHLRLLACAVPTLRVPLRPTPPPPMQTVQDVLVQVPVYNEPGAVSGCLAAVAALDWPRDRLTVQLLDDSTDETSAIAAAAIERLAGSGIRIRHLRRTERAGYKAGALAAGLALDAAPFVAMLDADFRPPPDWLAQGVARLLRDEGAAFVQFRFEIGNRDQTWMTRAQSLLVDAHFLCEQSGRAAAGEPFQFNGTAGIWRRSAIDAAGGWSGDTLAEDLDLTLRAYAKGWHGILVLSPALACEAPAQAQSWRVQQQRWSRGFVQVAAATLPLVLRSPWPLKARLATVLLLGIQLALPAAVALALGFLADAALRGFGREHALLLLAAGLGALSALVALTFPPYRLLRRGSIFRYAAAAAALPPLFVALALSNSASVVKAPFEKDREFVRTPKSGRL